MRIEISCDAVAREIRVDGDLAEWDPARARFQALKAPDPSLAGKDLSAEVALAWDADALYLAFHIQDEQVVPDTPNFWDADGIDLYFDVDAVKPGLPPSRFRLCLLPFNQGRPFGVVTWAGRRLLGPGGLSGIEVASRARGEGIGAYDIEARVPLRPLGISAGAGVSFGFDLGVRDHDRGDRLEPDTGPAEQATASLSGRADLSPESGSAPRLRLRGSNPAVQTRSSRSGSSSPWVGLVGAVIVLGLLLLASRSARRVQRSLLPRFPRWRTAGVALVVAIAALLTYGPDLYDRFAKWRATATLRERAERVRAALTELATPEIAARLRGADDAALRQLLSGQPLRTAQANRFMLLDVLGPGEIGPGEYRSLDPVPGVPFVEYGLRIGSGRTGAAGAFDLTLPEPEPTRRVHLALAAYLPEGTRSGQIENAVEVHLQCANRPAASTSHHLLTIDDARAEPIGHDSRAWGKAALRSGRPAARDDTGVVHEVAGLPLRHIDHYVIELDGGGATQADLARITIVPTAASAGVLLWISAITLERGTQSPEYLPLVLGGTDRNGFPRPVGDGHPAPRELRVAPRNHPEAAHAILYGRPNQPVLEVARLRIYYRAEGAVLRALADPANLKVRAWVLVTLDGSDAPLRFPLRAGIEVDDALLAELQHPASMTSFLASTFETRQGTLHYDGYELPLEAAVGTPGPFRVRKLEIEQPAETRGALLVAGVAASVRDEPAAPPPLHLLRLENNELSLAPEIVDLVAAADGRVAFAVARDGLFSQFGGVLPADVVERLRGTRIATPGGATPDAEAGITVGEEERAGRRYLTAGLACAFGSGSFRVVLLSELEGRTARYAARDAAALAAALLLLPLGLLLLVDALARITRVRVRLSLLFLLTSLAPLAVMSAVLWNVLASEQRKNEQLRAEEILGQVRERVQRLCDLATDHATRVLRDLDNEGLLSAPIGDGNVRRRLEQMAQAFPDRDAPVAIVVEALGEGGTVRRFYSSALTGADPRFEAPAVGLALSWGTLVFSGSAASSRRTLKVQVAGVVDARALKPLRMSPADGESLSFLSSCARRTREEVEGGEPLAGARIGGRIEGALARVAARSLDEGRDAYFAELGGGGTCGFDLIRGASGEPVAMAAASIGARPVLVNLGFARVELTWFVLGLGGVILAASLFLGTAVTEGITRPLARLLRGAVEHVQRHALARDPVATDRDAGPDDDEDEDEVASLESSFRRLSDELARRGQQQDLLAELVAAMGRPADLKERAWRALEFVHQLVGGQAVAAYVVEPAEAALTLVAQRSTTPNGRGFPPRIALSEPLVAHLLAERKPLRVAATSGTTAGELPLIGEGAAVLLPLERSQRAIGLLVTQIAATEDPLATVDSRHLDGVLAQVAAGLDSARLEARTIEDPETGLYVHTHFVARLLEETDRAAVQERPLALLLLRYRLSGGEGATSKEVERRCAAWFSRELRRVCGEREVVARAGALEFEVLAPLGGTARTDEIVRDVRGRIGDPATATDLPDGRLEVAAVRFPEDARSADFLLAALRRRLEMSGDAPADGAESLAAERFRLRFPEFAFASSRMQPVLRQIEKVAASDATVLILGETGTGKEVAAQLLHRSSTRSGQPFVAIHCAALPEKLLESELFGYEKGAFTGADQRRAGRFEQARGGTLFLDEVAEIPLSVQVKLLRVLQERKVQRLGAGEELAVDVRLVTATHQLLEKRVAEGLFREDLYYRLKVVTLDIPPLRERLDEIPSLVENFLAVRRQADPACRTRGIEPAALDLLARHPWPGNVRELRNVIERAIVLGDGELIRKQDIEFGTPMTADGRGLAAAGATAVAAATPAARTVAATPEPAAAGGRPGAPATGGGLDARARELVQRVRERGVITSREYCELAGVSQRTALRLLKECVDRGLLTRSGARKSASYRLSSDVAHVAESR